MIFFNFKNFYALENGSKIKILFSLNSLQFFSSLLIEAAQIIVCCQFLKVLFYKITIFSCF